MGRPRGAGQETEVGRALGALDRATSRGPGRSRARGRRRRRESGSSPRTRPSGVGVGGRVRARGADGPGSPLGPALVSWGGGERALERQEAVAVALSGDGPQGAPRPGAPVLETDKLTAGASGPRAPRPLGLLWLRTAPRRRAKVTGSEGRAALRPSLQDGRPGPRTPSSRTCRTPRGQGEPYSVDNGEFPPPQHTSW